ncbi:MAG: hypothetical protein OXD37_00500 [Acidimicrobiaceae bacterium]|nr:hypothetical protein [Acidimicrobiaceae bacterium]
MSIPVAPEDLAATVREYEHGPTAFVLTVGDDGRTRVIHARASVDDGGVVKASVGRSAAANVSARPDVVVLWMPAEADGFCLIADGIATVDAEPGAETPIIIETFSAVRHKPPA